MERFQGRPLSEGLNGSIDSYYFTIISSLFVGEFKAEKVWIAKVGVGLNKARVRVGVEVAGVRVGVGVGTDVKVWVVFMNTVWL